MIPDEDNHHEVDIIIYATGFTAKEGYAFMKDHNDFAKDFWENDVRTYLGTFHPRKGFYGPYLLFSWLGRSSEP